MLDNLQKTCTRCGAPRDYIKHTWCSSCCRDYYVAKSGGMVQMSCKRCGDAFECTGRSARHRMFCSRLCKDEARKDADKLARAQAKTERACPRCGGKMPPTMRTDAMFCSETCREAACNARKQGPERRAKRKAELLASKSARPCRGCGVEIGPDRKSNTTYCSLACWKRANWCSYAHIRRANKRGAQSEKIDREYIYQRDKGRCQQCGKRVPFSKMTEGHIIPVTPYRPGDPVGSYTRENIRLECRSCNFGKQNRPANEQLMLVG